MSENNTSQCESRIAAFSLIRKLGGWKYNEIALWPDDRLAEYITKLRERADAKGVAGAD